MFGLGVVLQAMTQMLDSSNDCEQQMASNLLRLLVNKINDCEPNVAKEIQTVVDILGREEAEIHFEKVFGTSLETFVIDGNLDLDGKCNTEEKLKAVARVLAINVEIDGWNGTLK